VTQERPDEGHTAPARLLVELVNNHLDPGYAAAARRRGPDAPPRWYDRPTVVVGCALIGLVLGIAYIHTHRGAPEAAKVHGRLVDRVRAAQHRADDLANQLSELERKVSAARDRALSNSGPLANRLSLAELQAGQVAVAGPGLTVTLRDPAGANASPSPGRGGTTPIGATNILTDRDVRSVVNELWHDGAEAIAVNDVRLTPTSAIRFAGEAVLVDFEPITSPYQISAIGDSDTLATNFAESSVASRYQTLTGVEHIGFEFTDSEHLTLPAGSAAKLRYATASAGKRGPR
jgi:uncharacterized protein YlxW (UPF0749 family)